MSTTLTSVDLNSCDREPIHAPGSIQPHGMMLVATLHDLHIRHVAGDVEQRLGVAGWRDQPLDRLIGEVLSNETARLVAPGAVGGFVGQLRAATGETLDVTACRSGDFVIIELEAASIERLSASAVLDRVAAAASGFERAATLAAVCDLAAIEFRRLTGFDRVMVYRFLDDDAGKVLAEDRRSDLQSFQNHYFPAFDIPRQASALYVRNVLRVIPDVAYEPVPLRPRWAGPEALDMSDSNLRSVSPTHLHSLRNMGVGASASFSIIKDGVLWGLVACHNDTPKLLTFDIRAACRFLVASLSRQIKARDEAEGFRQHIRLRSFEDDMVALLSRPGSLQPALSAHLDEIRRMTAGDGVAVLRGRELVLCGLCPDDAEIHDLAAWITALDSGPIFTTDCLSLVYPPANRFKASCSGILAMVLSADEPWLLLWFRGEQVETIKWAGNPLKMPTDDPAEPLTPRASFASWAETVSGRAFGWSQAEIEAALRLRAALLDVQQNRRMRELNLQLTRILQDKDLLLAQKEFLISEINHRVHNSLQLVGSFLGLQANTSKNSELQAALEEARRRLTAVGLVHRRLYRGEQVDMVNMARYIEELCADTFAFMGQDWARHLTLNIAPLLVSPDRAMTLGLVLTELLINSNKYAYGGIPGPIEIGLIEDHSHFRMIVSDKGVGAASARTGFGSRIMEGLVGQLGGTLVQGDNQPGLRVTVTMPVQSWKKTYPAAAAELGLPI